MAMVATITPYPATADIAVFELLIEPEAKKALPTPPSTKAIRAKQDKKPYAIEINYNELEFAYAA